MSEDEALSEVVESARSSGFRFQGLVPVSETTPRHVVAYRWPAEGGPRFERAELVVEPGEVTTAALAVLREPPADEETIDVLVCSHGRRDRCCGSLGTGLAMELLSDPRPLGQRVRVWRTSHTGGHRFAPTTVVLPQGTAWAFCDTAMLATIVKRDGPVDGLLGRYRGCAGMASPAVQVLERAVLGVIGWPLFDMVRHGRQLEDGRTELVVEGPGGESIVFEALVHEGETLPVPDCGGSIELATKSEAQLVVGGLRRR
jgi:hypothetical protein